MALGKMTKMRLVFWTVDGSLKTFPARGQVSLGYLGNVPGPCSPVVVEPSTSMSAKVRHSTNFC